MTLKSDGELIAVYSYDALGRRIQKVVTNSGGLDGTTDYYYDGQQDIEEHNGSGTLTQQYVYGSGINELLVMDRNLNGGSTATGPGDQRLFYYQNALGSVYALTDIDGQDPRGLPVRRLRPPDGVRPRPERRRGLRRRRCGDARRLEPARQSVPVHRHEAGPRGRALLRPGAVLQRTPGTVHTAGSRRRRRKPQPLHVRGGQPRQLRRLRPVLHR